MTDVPSQSIQSYVLDTSAIINLERSNHLKQLLVFPGDWLIVPSIVARELNPNISGTPAATKNWLNGGKVAMFIDKEESLYRRLVLHPGVDDGEAQAIAMARNRGATLVIDEKKNGQVWNIAESHGIRCISSAEFLNEIKPRLPGL